MTSVRSHMKAGGASDPGRQRTNNEDRIYCDPGRGIFIVIDGMGGQAAGEKAADIALSHLKARLERRSAGPAERIREAIAAANNEIYRVAQSHPDWQGMGCVLTAALIEDHQATIGHVGDTRLYKLQSGKIRKITHDHSPVGEREDAGKLSEWEAMRHPRRNEVYRDVGTEPRQPDHEDFVDVLQITFEPDSALLLCTDGLTDLITAAEIREIVESNAGDPYHSAAELIQAANKAGGKDNVSAIVVEGESFARAMKGGSVLTNRAAAFVYGALAVILLLAGFSWIQPYLKVRSSSTTDNPPPQVLRVVPNGSEFQTIVQALEKARPGDIVEVAPGEYKEEVRLKEGVHLISQKLFEAIIRGPDQLEEGSAAVTAYGINAGRISGFKIEGSGNRSWGLSIVDSNVHVDQADIAGMREAAILIAGKSRPVLTSSYIHDNSGAGILVKGEARPKIANNVVVRNGRDAEPRRSGIEIVDRANPQLERNVIAGNGLDGIFAADPALGARLREKNLFFLEEAK